MASQSQKRASANHRRRAAAHGLARVEIKIGTEDVSLIKALAAILRNEPEQAKALRFALQHVVGVPQAKTAFDIFGADAPDDMFDGVFDQPRQSKWRETGL